MPSASSTSKIRLSWLRKSSGVCWRLALYSTYCSCLNVGSPRSNATATCVGFSSRSTLMSIAVTPSATCVRHVAYGDPGLNGVYEEKAKMVVEVKVWPAASTVDGKLDWLGEFGKCWVSNVYAWVWR